MKAKTKQQWAQMQRLRAQGLSYAKIAERMDINRTTVARILNRIAHGHGI